jgi:hypothetical protein
MTYTEIYHLQKRIGTTPDGFWGRKSIAACQTHLKSLMPLDNPWPRSDQASLMEFYGNPGDEYKLVSIDVSGLGVKYDGQTVKTIRCHRKVADSLHRVLVALDGGICAWILGQYAGVYNNRPMRGGSLPSLHARGAAIDLDPAPNGNHRSWPVNATMPIQVMEEFAKEGWIGLGWAIGRDAMHFQATK